MCLSVAENSKEEKNSWSEGWHKGWKVLCRVVAPSTVNWKSTSAALRAPYVSAYVYKAGVNRPRQRRVERHKDKWGTDTQQRFIYGGALHVFTTKDAARRCKRNSFDNQSWYKIVPVYYRTRDIVDFGRGYQVAVRALTIEEHDYNKAAKR